MTGRDRFRAEIIYDENTVRLMDQTVTDAYHPLRRVVWLLVAVAMILYGVSVGIDSPLGMLFLFAGCILLPVSTKMTSYTGTRILRVMKGKQMRMSYRFASDGIYSRTAGSDETRTRYSDIIRMIQRKQYIYLFLNRNQALMIDTQTLTPKDAAGFESFLKQQTELDFSEAGGLTSIRLSTLIDLFRNRKKQNHK